MSVAHRVMTIAVLLSMLPAIAAAQTPFFVKDLDTNTHRSAESYSSAPQDMSNAFGKMIFTASTAEYGAEPWITDGTQAGTVMVKDINPGMKGSNPATPGVSPQAPRGYVVYNGVVLFSANDGVHGGELWMTDGTAAGTSMVKDINPAGDAFDDWTEFQPAIVNGIVFFAAQDANGTELWRSDGTEAGTFMVKDVSGSSRTSSSPSGLIALGNLLLFSATDGHGVELWRSDGTATGTLLVRDIRVGTGSSVPSNFLVYGGTLLFSANDGSGEGLWRSDGTAAGTAMLARIDARSGDNATLGIAFNGKVYFGANDGISGSELWTTDGTAAGTQLVKDINPGAPSSDPGIATGERYSRKSFAVFNGLVYFTATDGVSGCELWASDGTAGGTVLVKDIIAGTGSSAPAFLTSTGTHLVFTGLDASGYSRIYGSDGTADGTVEAVTDLDPGDFCVLNGVAYYAAGWNGGIWLGNPPALNRELWRTDGTVTGTYLFKDIAPWVNGNGNPEYRAVLGEKMILARARQSGPDCEAWITDGTESGTIPLGPTIGFQDWTAATLTTTSMFAGDMDGKLWKTDGTPTGTALVKDFGPDEILGNLTYLFSTLYFTKSDGLWKSDGTASGTVLATTVTPLRKPVMQWGKMFFPAVSRVVNGSNIEGVFVSDGTSAGTVLLSEITTTQLVVTAAAVFISGYDSVGYGIWKTDGTPAGTVLVKSGTKAKNLLPFGSLVLFETAPSSLDVDCCANQLWRTDGTAAGTVMFKEFSRTCGSYPGPMTTVGSAAYFSACTDSLGTELWKTSGTSSSTSLVRDIFPGRGSSFPQNLISANGRLWFQANDGTYGEELWRSGGTASSTIRISDIVSGTGASAPIPLRLAGTRLFFSAWQPEIGRELWALDVTQIPSPCGDANGDSVVDAADVFYLLQHLFAGGAAPVGRADVNKDGTLTAADVFRVIEFLFVGGTPLDC